MNRKIQTLKKQKWRQHNTQNMRRNSTKDPDNEIRDKKSKRTRAVFALAAEISMLMPKMEIRVKLKSDR